MAAERVSAQTYRLFIAIALPLEIKRAVLAARENLREAAPLAAIRWTAENQMHLTLRFLGNMPVGAVDGLIAEISTSLRPFTAVSLSARGIGFFPKPSSPRVVWAGIDDQGGQLRSLHKALQSATCSLSAEPEANDFTPHLTLGRIREISRDEISRLRSVSQRLSAALFGEWTTTEIALMRSQLSATGAQYSVLATFPLTS